MAPMDKEEEEAGMEMISGMDLDNMEGPKITKRDMFCGDWDRHKIRCDAYTYYRFQVLVEQFFENQWTQTVLGVMIVWSLFNDDIRLTTSDDGDDIIFTVIISVLFFIFVIEILAAAMYKPDYILLPEWSEDPDESAIQRWQKFFQFGSFYFWLDIIATFSLVIEVGM
jgi:hypothetical protein